MAENYEEDDTPEGAVAAAGKAIWNTHGSDIARLSKKVTDSHAFHLAREAVKPLEVVDKGLENLGDLHLAPGPRKLSNVVGTNVRSFAKAAQPWLGRAVKTIGNVENIKDLMDGVEKKDYKKIGIASGLIGMSALQKGYTFIPEMALADWKYSTSGEKPANNDHGILVDDAEGDNELGIDPETLIQIRKNGAIRSTPAPVRAIRDAALFNPSDFTVPQAPYQVME